MELSGHAFSYVISLAAVVNGLGIVRLVTALSDYLRFRHRIHVEPDPLYIALLAFQFLLHVLMWWSIWGVRSIGGFDFVDYLFLLSGPTLLFLATGLLVPEVSSDALDMRAELERIRPSYFTVMVLAISWSILLWPVLGKGWSPSTWVFALFLVAGLVGRFSPNRGVLAAVVLLLWAVMITHIARYGMLLGAASSIQG